MESRPSSDPATVGGKGLLIEGTLGGIISIVMFAVPPHVPWIVLGPIIAGFVAGARTRAGFVQAIRLSMFIAWFLAVFALLIIGIVGFVAATIPRASLTNTPFADFDFGFSLLLAVGVSVYAFCLGLTGAFLGGKFASRRVP